MRAIGYRQAGPVSARDSLVETEQATPQIGRNDLLVEVRGLSVNPVDVKVRSRVAPEDDIKVIGYDAAGIVKQVGPGVSRFKVGDAVFYAGDLTRPGANSELHAVDERIVGKKPRSLDFAEAAALPLTSITAWEILFDCFALQEGDGVGDSLLIIGAAGGVGSILIQLAKRLTGLAVIATASRLDTQDWVRKMGADQVISHRKDLAGQVKSLGREPRYIAGLNATGEHFASMVELIKPRGHIAVIDDAKQLDISAIKPKALSFSWEFMFARSMHQTEDMDEQHKLLNRVSELVDQGRLVTTATNNLGSLSVETLKQAHELQESGKVIGKNVLQGFAREPAK